MSREPRDDALRKRLRGKFAALQHPCGICGEPIDYSVPYPHPLSAAVDHIVPLSRGGADVMDNCQSTHRACNRAKSNSMPGDSEGPRSFITSRVW